MRQRRRLINPIFLFNESNSTKPEQIIKAEVVSELQKNLSELQNSPQPTPLFTQINEPTWGKLFWYWSWFLLKTEEQRWEHICASEENKKEFLLMKNATDRLAEKGRETNFIQKTGITLEKKMN